MIHMFQQLTGQTLREVSRGVLINQPRDGKRYECPLNRPRNSVYDSVCFGDSALRNFGEDQHADEDNDENYGHNPHARTMPS